jgi:hypothetical protein
MTQQSTNCSRNGTGMGFGVGCDAGGRSVDLGECLAALDRFAGLDLAGWAPAELVAALAQVGEIRRRTDGLMATLAARSERLGAAVRTAGVDTVTHLAMSQRMTPREAAGLVKQGEVLRRFSVLGDACAKGELSLPQAKACADRLEAFPADILGDAALEAAQKALVGEASQAGPRDLGVEAGRLVADALTSVGVDPQEQVEAEHRQAVKMRHIWFKDEGASTRFGGQLPRSDGERWKATLAAMAKRTQKQPGGAEPNPDGSEPSSAALMIDAQTALVDRADSAETTARPLPQVSVLMDGAALGVGVLRGESAESGESLASSALAEALCDCEVRRIVLGPSGEPLDVGRAHRLVPPPIRRALDFRDGGCCFPGCDQPASNTHAHHLIPWWAEGPTSLENLASVCHRHHVVVEPAREARDGVLPGERGWDDPTRWRIIIDAADGLPRAVPPARVDPEREPILHARLRARLRSREARPGESATGFKDPPDRSRLAHEERRLALVPRELNCDV